MRHDLTSDILYVLNNAENIGRQSCMIPASKLVKSVLMVMQKSGYIGTFEFVDDGRSGFFNVKLIGKINMSRSIRPRFAVQVDKYKTWSARYLPARGFGLLIVSTPKGVMSHIEAEESGLGGRLVGYVY